MSIARLAKRLAEVEADIRRRYPTTYERTTNDAWEACFRAVHHRRLDNDDFEAVFEQFGARLRQVFIQRARARRVVRLASNEPEVPLRIPFPHFNAFISAVEILSYRPNETASPAHVYSLTWWRTMPIGALSCETRQAAEEMVEWFAERLALRILGPHDGIELRTQIWNRSGCISAPITPLGRERPNTPLSR